MPVSRAQHETVWPRRSASQRWAELFSFDDLSRSQDGLRVAWERAFATTQKPRELTLGGVRCLELPLLDGRPADRAEPVVLHLHGGGYLMGSARAALGQAAVLGAQARARVLCVDYRLAPEHAYPAPVEDLRSVVAALVQTGTALENVFLSGEGSGAAIALSTLMALRDAGHPMPRGFLAVSPFADMTLSGESMLVNGFADEFLHRDMLTYMSTSYTQRTPAVDPGVSPVFGRFDGLPPMLLIAGQHEALLSDAVRIAQQARAAGGFARLLLANTGTHAFTQFPAERAREPALQLMARFVTRVHRATPGSLHHALSAEDQALIEQL
jgi:salicylate hydroxylase